MMIYQVDASECWLRLTSLGEKEQPVSGAGKQKLRILCADDDPDIRTITQLSLGLDGDMEIDCVSDGPSVLFRLERGPRPDVVLLDALMPEMSGTEVAKAIRSMPATADMPIIFLTAHADPGSFDALYQSGATAVIAKPFDPLFIAQQIRRIIAGDMPTNGKF